MLELRLPGASAGQEGNPVLGVTLFNLSLGLQELWVTGRATTLAQRTDGGPGNSEAVVLAVYWSGTWHFTHII